MPPITGRTEYDMAALKFGEVSRKLQLAVRGVPPKLTVPPK